MCLPDHTQRRWFLSGCKNHYRNWKRTGNPGCWTFRFWGVWGQRRSWPSAGTASSCCGSSGRRGKKGCRSGRDTSRRWRSRCVCGNRSGYRRETGEHNRDRYSRGWWFWFWNSSRGRVWLWTGTRWGREHCGSGDRTDTRWSVRAGPGTEPGSYGNGRRGNCIFYCYICFYHNRCQCNTRKLLLLQWLWSRFLPDL